MNDRLNTEQILDAFAAEPSHDLDTLKKYLNEYPDLRLELLELASEIRMVSDTAQFATEAIADPRVDDAWNSFTSAGTKVEKSIFNPFQKFTRQRFTELCKGLGLPRGFVIAIRDKRVQLESIPERFLQAAASIMETTVEDLRRYLHGTPHVVRTAEFKADKKPMVVEQITFQQLIEDTDLSEEQRRTALGYLADDGPN